MGGATGRMGARWFVIGAVALAAPTARAYCLLDSRWQSGVVRMHHRFPTMDRLLNGTRSFEANVASAMLDWSAVTDGFRFVLEGPTDAGADRRDGVNNLIMVDTIDGSPFDEEVLAITFSRTTDRGNMLESDVLFNANLQWNAYDGPVRFDENLQPVFDLRRVALHELGHVLGLDHPDLSCDELVDSVMNSRVTDTSSLTVDDRNGVSFLYADGNQPPIADAGADQIGNGTTPFTLNASASRDLDGTIETHEWRLDGEIVARTAVAQVDVPFGTHVAQITVFDDDGGAAEDSAVIEVGLTAPTNDPENLPPRALAGMDIKLQAGELAELDGSASFDPDGLIQRFVWSESGAVLGRDAVIPFAFSVGTHRVTLTVFDDDGASDSDEIDVLVMLGDTGDAGPVIVVTTGPGPNPICGALGFLTATAMCAFWLVSLMGRAKAVPEQK